ncbi:MAG: DUF2264 domain-containing protein [Prevotellaceae bacterium]|jgi:hypothetical protein|nr:DUF2264 domain-containing protein [Prevotellaceae bacterium]
MKSLLLSVSILFMCLTITAQLSDREYWANLAYETAAPILSSMSRGELRKNMPLEVSPKWDGRDKNVAYLEAFGRLMNGIVPWLALPDDDTPEGKRRKQLREWALLSYASAVNPDSPDYLLWQGQGQALVDAAFLAQSFIRAPKTFWEPLDETTKQRYVDEFKGLRRIVPGYNNWLLFRATIEAFLFSIGEEHDMFAIDVTIRKMDEWYVGDGWYSDGNRFAYNYYGGFVIHPMTVEIVEILKRGRKNSAISFETALERMQRFNVSLERMISPEGTFPPVGRSITYRMGVFQTVALSAWKYGLPKELTSGQVRNALTTVMKRMFAQKGNFDKSGFLQLGFAGHQPEIADSYTNTGSLYLTAFVFLPLGLPADDQFWTSPPEKWTSQKAWDGESFPKDGAIR